MNELSFIVLNSSNAAPGVLQRRDLVSGVWELSSGGWFAGAETRRMCN